MGINCGFRDISYMSSSQSDPDNRCYCKNNWKSDVYNINCVGRNHPSWSQTQKTKGGISGYNAGCGNVQTYDGMNSFL